VLGITLSLNIGTIEGAVERQGFLQHDDGCYGQGDERHYRTHMESRWPGYSSVRTGWSSFGLTFSLAPADEPPPAARVPLGTEVPMAIKPAIAKIVDFETSFDATPVPAADGMEVWADVRIEYILAGLSHRDNPRACPLEGRRNRRTTKGDRATLCL
jgi:hypothetical protein